MQCDTAIAVGPTRSDRLAFALKWGASAIQIMGYAATAFGWTPWNIYLFLVGVLGLWDEAMQTLALMLVSTAIAVSTKAST